MIFEKLIISKLIHEYKFLEVKTKNNLINVILLLFITNFIIDNFFAYLSY